MPLLLDTGVLYAIADADDDWHKRVVEYLRAASEVLTAPVTVLPEVAYLLHVRLGARAERTFIASLAAGDVTVEPLTTVDLTRASTLMVKYPAIGFVDASVVAVAERLRLS